MTGTRRETLSPRRCAPPGIVAGVVAALAVGMAVRCQAADVQVVGVTPGASAVVVIDGGDPITLEIGDVPVEGIVVVATDRTGATLAVDGTERAVPVTEPRTAAIPSAPRAGS